MAALPTMDVIIQEASASLFGLVHIACRPYMKPFFLCDNPGWGVARVFGAHSSGTRHGENVFVECFLESAIGDVSE